MIPMEYLTARAEQNQNPPACFSLFTKIRSAVPKFMAKILKKNQPSFDNLELPSTVPAAAGSFQATQEEEIISGGSTPRAPSPEETMIQRGGLHHPIFKLIKELKLGKAVLNIAVPTVVTVLASGGSCSCIGPKKTPTALTHAMVSGVCLGSAGILNGILLRETFPREANAIELFGTVVGLICLNGLVGSFLPVEFIWLPILCGDWCLFPFLIMILY